MKILIAEGNVVNAKVAKAVLLQFGYQSDLVTNGREALEAVVGNKYDVVFMDVQMPGMDGIVATRYIRTDISSSKRPYIIAMTANAMNEDRGTLPSCRYE
jgi:CheY-like chemotaxis protein